MYNLHFDSLYYSDQNQCAIDIYQLKKHILWIQGMWWLREAEYWNKLLTCVGTKVCKCNGDKSISLAYIPAPPNYVLLVREGKIMEGLLIVMVITTRQSHTNQCCLGLRKINNTGTCWCQTSNWTNPVTFTAALSFFSSLNSLLFLELEECVKHNVPTELFNLNQNQVKLCKKIVCVSEVTKKKNMKMQKKFIHEPSFLIFWQRVIHRF